MEQSRAEKIEAVAARRLFGVAVVLEDIHDPHNAGAIMRTCDGLGIQDVHFVFQEEKAYNPRRVGKSSSSSANKWLSIHTHKSTEACLTALAADGYTSVGTVLLGGTTELSAYDFRAVDMVAIWVGNEHRGLSEEARSACAALITIPMQGFVESFNVSVAAALVLSEVARARKGHTRTGAELSTLVEELKTR